MIHSSSLLSTLSSKWTSKPPLAVKYRLDTTALDQPNSVKSLCSTLDRLLAWEKKLYEEIKVLNQSLLVMIFYQLISDGFFLFFRLEKV